MSLLEKTRHGRGEKKPDSSGGNLAKWTRSGIALTFTASLLIVSKCVNQNTPDAQPQPTIGDAGMGKPDGGTAVNICKAPAKKKKLKDAINENPKIILCFLDDPNTLFPYLPNNTQDEREKSRETVNFIKLHRNEGWAKRGAEKLKNDVNGGKFNPNLGMKEFLDKYFPDMPGGLIAKIIWIWI